MGADPAKTVRRMKDASVVRAAEAVRDGEASSMLSAGNTGAAMAAALLRMGRMRGVARPAIAVPYPVLGSTPTTVLDCGANADCQPEWLVQFARLGTAYLDELMEVFDGNMVMVSAGYNAGPGRPIRWMNDRGDPRRGQIDVVDWIEHIPFDETRNYVMRVTESIPVYRARLSGHAGAIGLSDLLLSRPGHVRLAQKGEFTRPRARPEILTE